MSSLIRFLYGHCDLIFRSGIAITRLIIFVLIRRISARVDRRRPIIVNLKVAGKFEKADLTGESLFCRNTVE